MDISSVLSKPRAWIADEWVDPSRRFPVRNPATGEIIAQVADCGPDEAARAVQVAEKAFAAWKRSTAYERSRILRRFYELMMEHKEPLARLMTQEMGKPIRESRGEVNYAAGFVEWYAEEAKRLYGDTIPTAFEDKRILVQPAPVGPVFAVTPWNFPAAMVTRKLAPALAAGCTLILKPAEQSPLTALALAQLLAEAGLPPGVFQVLPTNTPGPLADVILADERIRKLTFTGSTEVGKMLYAKAAHTVKRVSLEMGGNAPLLVFEDADIKKAATEAVGCKFRNAGQTCVCSNRIYVHENALEPFLEAFSREVQLLRVGLPSEETTDIGPLVDAQGLAKVKSHIEDALDRGARLISGGRVLDQGVFRGGYFIEPTILTHVTSRMKIASEETFGPVAPIFTFKTEQEVLEAANDTPYGLAAYVFTRDASRLFRLAEGLDYGIIGFNDGVPSTPQAPFGGMKASGVGREGGRYGIEEYIERKYVSVKL